MDAPRLPPRLVQIAGVRGREEAVMLLDAGADLLGLPLRLPVHDPDMSEDEAAALARDVGGERVCLITYESNPAETAALCRRLDAGAVQLHGGHPPGTLAAVRSALPRTLIIASLIVRSPDSAPLLAEAEALAPHCHAFITDTFDPATGASGATGLTHPWEVDRELARRCGRPLILAGGLTPDNVAEAVRLVRPAGVDAHTGLEDADGTKNPDKVRRFVAEAKKSLAAPSSSHPPVR
ncbi:phosphoribosylanthranilate isomerase [Desulfohalovibrio reitneri]|uniref:phosphoribosylanthranilate isomerase n=1 Tax=Desulfohalovibrio reitneri TaxID=1307759 RepID=UPI0004A716A0|nr:phosphoribosylanthranilate isomerase [Desulfohalovibrio reitneri]